VTADNQFLVPVRASDTIYVIKNQASLVLIGVDRHQNFELWCQLLISVGTKNQFLKKHPSPDLGSSGSDPSPLSQDRAAAALVEPTPTPSLPWRSLRRRYLEEPTPFEESCRRGALKSHNRHQATPPSGHAME
jgi:hypothetical protein